MLCDFEEPVAPPQPSRPVRPPNKITTSSGSGLIRTTFSSGAAAMTAPTSYALQRIPDDKSHVLILLLGQSDYRRNYIQLLQVVTILRCGSLPFIVFVNWF